ncbi:hypothetical protein E2562_024073, partial [Oryza meyeriana var. granulata]
MRETASNSLVPIHQYRSFQYMEAKWLLCFLPPSSSTKRESRPTWWPPLPQPSQAQTSRPRFAITKGASCKSFFNSQIRSCQSTLPS